MLYVGLSWLLFWALVVGLEVGITKAAAITGIVFVVVALVLEGVPSFKRS